MFNKFEVIGAGLSVGVMALAIYLLQSEVTPAGLNGGQAAQVVATQEDIVVVGDDENVTQARAEAYYAASNRSGNIQKLVIDDVKIGVGEEVKEGDTVVVHYIGTLQNGQEFDNSRKRGQPFEVEVGAGRVIQGWDEGLVGMKTGGQRILVIPPEKAYGTQGVGPIPPNATLVFAIELLEIK